MCFISKHYFSISSILMVLGFAFSAQTYADDSDWYVSMEAGAAVPMANTTTTTVSMSGSNFPDNYVMEQPSDSGYGGIGVGYQLSHTPWTSAQWLPNFRFGVLYDYIGNATTNGDIEKFQEYQAYNFSYQLHSQIIWFDDQADLFSWNRLSPYVEIAIGSAFNNTNGYTEVPAGDDFPPRHGGSGAAFANNTNTQFAFMPGAGVNYGIPIKKHMINVGVGYRFMDLGNSQTGASAYYPGAQSGLSAPIKDNMFVFMIRTNL